MDPRYTWLRYSTQFVRETRDRMIQMPCQPHWVWVPDEFPAASETMVLPWMRWGALHRDLTWIRTYDTMRAFLPSQQWVRRWIPGVRTCCLVWNHYVYANNRWIHGR